MNKIKIFTLIFFLITNESIAKQSVESTPWGYNGIINVPNSNVLEKGKFYINSAYTIKNPSFLSSFQMGLLDNLEIGILGGIPSDIYSGLSGNLKYQILKQNKDLPLSFAMGINLLGIKKIGNNNSFFNLGNALYMIASHDLNINSYNILSAHIGFSGNLEGANLLTAIDIPITKFVNLGLEYTSRTNVSNEMINFGLKIRPIDELSINLFSLGTNFSQGFRDTEYMIGLSYNSNLFLNNKIADKVEENKIAINKEENKVQKQNNSEESKKIEKENTNKEEKIIIKEGSLKITVNDENDNSNLSNVKMLLENKENNIYNKFDINETIYTVNNLKYGNYKLTFEKENYETLIYPIKIDSNLNNINVKMKKISSSISAKVFNNNSIPYPDLDITLNENIKTKTDKEGKFTFNNILPGKYIIKISKNNYLLKKIDIDLLKGMDLKREIYLDEIKSSSTKTTNLNKDENKNDLKENRKQETTKEEKITSKNIETKNESQNLKKENNKEEKKSNNSLVVGKITSEGKIVPSARVTLEGDKVTIMTISNKEGFYLIKNIPSGQYKITVSKSGFIDKTSKINLENNNQYKFDIILEKKN